MATPRERHDEEHVDIGPAHSYVLRAETLRSSGDSGKASSKVEDKVSVFWRLFGGTLLSITALVVLTVYQQFTASLTELRTNLSHLNESRGDLVKLDDFNTRTTALWNGLKELQAAGATLPVLKERSTLLEQQVKTSQDQLNTRVAALAASLKDLEAAVGAMAALKERSALLEQQVKSSEEERKEQSREVLHLRERLAALEGRQAATTPTYPPPDKRLSNPSSALKLPSVIQGLKARP